MLFRSLGLLNIANQIDSIQIMARLLSQGKKETVSEVSIEEAAENLLQIASLPNTKTLLLTEWIRKPQKRRLQPYVELQQKLAEQNEHIYYINLRKTLPDHDINQFLLDANHPSSEGHQQIAKLIHPWIIKELTE